MMQEFLSCAILLVSSAVSASKDVYLPPSAPSSASRPSCSLVLIAGAGAAPEAYRPLAEAIQKVPVISIAILIPHLPQEIADPVGVRITVRAAMARLTREGADTTNVFFAGHSQGGAMIQQYLTSHSTPANSALGLVLMGSFLLRSHRAGWALPTLTISGSLDGLARVTRLAEAYYMQNTSQYAVVVAVEGMNHWQFASGPAPANVRSHDLLPTIADSEAQRSAAMAVSYFIESVLRGQTWRKSSYLTKADTTTRGVLDPIIRTMQAEGYHGFGKACNCFALVCNSSFNCTKGSPWSEQAQRFMAGMTIDPRMDSTTVYSDDNFHIVWHFIPPHFPILYNSCLRSSPTAQCALNVSTVSELAYETLDDFDTGFWPVTAKEIKAKMISRQALLQAAGYPNVSFSEADEKSLCAQINKKSYEYALQVASGKARSLFLSAGVPLEFGEDVITSAGPLWIWNGLKFTTNSSGSHEVMTVSAPTLRLAVFPGATHSGVHYCKLLSPARAMEWITIDGLRKNRSLSSVL